MISAALPLHSAALPLHSCPSPLSVDLRCSSLDLFPFILLVEGGASRRLMVLALELFGRLTAGLLGLHGRRSLRVHNAVVFVVPNRTPKGLDLVIMNQATTFTGNMSQLIHQLGTSGDLTTHNDLMHVD